MLGTKKANSYNVFTWREFKLLYDNVINIKTLCLLNYIEWCRRVSYNTTTQETTTGMNIKHSLKLINRTFATF